ncbi:MAG: hypothetical protein KGL00_04270, partial [Gammaproteobacteria bacterium]|nr:hypothetical protein [Gammaproteobacteria bacterium]
MMMALSALQSVQTGDTDIYTPGVSAAVELGRYRTYFAYATAVIGSRKPPSGCGLVHKLRLGGAGISNWAPEDCCRPILLEH